MQPKHWREIRELPLPKGDSLYALAKRTECIAKDIPKAMDLYHLAIESGDRSESAVKDLAGLLHQGGSTQQACELLEQYSGIFADQLKFQNLLENLRGKLIPTGNALYKQLKISPLTEYDSLSSVRRLFRDPSRIVSIEILHSTDSNFGVLHFSSHSAAKKTLGSLHKWSNHLFHWLGTQSEEVPTHPSRYRDKTVHKFTHKDPVLNNRPSTDQETAKRLIGKDLFEEL